MSNTDRPLKTIPTEDLRVVVNELFDAIQSAEFCGLKATAEKLRYMRQPITDELRERARVAIRNAQ